jgi:GTP-binding protein
VAPFDGSDPVADAAAIVDELARFSPALAARERWLVLTKLDLLPPDERAERVAALLAAIGGDAPAYAISALSGDGLKPLLGDVMNRLEALGPALPEGEPESPPLGEDPDRPAAGPGALAPDGAETAGGSAGDDD